jgi:phosphatidylserine/phosphatidylglycerophosphate/cardiolipin synthase-like enzyme
MMSEPNSATPDRLVVAAGDRREALLSVIRGAERRITLSLFRCNDDEIFAALTEAVGRGVAVEVLVTSRSKGGKKRREKLSTRLEQTGAMVHTYNDPVVKYHAKYLVADDGPAVVASLNFTKKCFRKTCDALVITYDAAVVSDLRRLMAADRDRAPAPADLSSRLILGPERARRQLTALIAGARTSIRIIDPKLTDPDLVALLKERRAAGVDVEIVGAKRIGTLKSHGKIMLVDGATLVVGSLALAALSLDFRREVAIVVDEPSAVAEAAQLFGEVGGVRSTKRPVAVDAAGRAAC